MATQMEEKLKAAGIKLPVIQRIWMWLKDHPDKRASEVGAALGLDASTANTHLNALEVRGMVTSRLDFWKPLSRHLKWYKVTPHMQKYELLPMPLEHRQRVAAQNYFRNHGEWPKDYTGPRYLAKHKLALAQEEEELAGIELEQPVAAPSATSGSVQGLRLDLGTGQVSQAPAATPEPVPAMTADEELVDFIANLPVLRAKAIYIKLKEIFG